MKCKHFLGCLILIMNVVFAQENESAINSQNIPKQTFLDSIKNQFVYHETAACVDSRWVNYYINNDLFAEMENDLVLATEQDTVDYDLSTEMLKKRLEYLDAKSAFNISYNETLEKSIKYYLKNRKKSFERLIGMSEYYFPYFEESLSKYNLPLEIKYLAIVESALNPKAVSRVGATGLWQFMYGTAKQYKLEINTFVDERSDLLKSTEAACQYMSNMYQIFGDWDLVLASYNAGPGNVSKAIRRSGGKQNYWNIRPFLPKETQGYVPAFLATMYVYEFHKDHGYEPQSFEYKPVLTDTIRLKQKVTFKQLSELLDISIEELQFLNPSYKRDFVPFQTDKTHAVRLPLDKVAIMTSNEKLIYDYINQDFAKEEQPIETLLVEDIEYYTVKRGDYLGKIANRYNVSVNDIKRWNHLRGNNLKVGKKLKIERERKVVAQPKKTELKQPIQKPEEATNTNEKELTEIQIVDSETDLKTTLEENTEVLSDETKEKIDNKEEITSSEINENSFKKIYTIQKGENLYLIAKKFKVSVDDLKKWNQLKDNDLAVNQTLIVYLTPDDVIDEKREEESIKENQSKYKTYVVQSGDSLYSISSKFEGISISDLKKWNALKSNNIKPGMKLIIKHP